VENSNFSDFGYEQGPPVTRVVPAYPVVQPSYRDDIEVINLDDCRDAVKPTTWH